MDGVEAANLIREESDAPILVLTGSGDSELLQRAEAAGTSGRILKPFSEHGLLSAVRTRLTQRDSEDFGLRCMVESMLRDGASEETIVRTLRATTSSGDSRTRAQGRPGLRSIVRALTHRRVRAL
jgi:DNA-binding NarL/FixJ family response regulator